MSIKTTLVCSLLTAVLALGGSVALAAQGYEVLPGVVTDSELTTVFFMRDGGGVEAVQVGQGLTTWTSDAADKPLAFDGNRLVAQRNASVAGALHMVTLDNSVGARLESVDVSLPAGVTAAVDKGRAGYFEAFAVADGDEASLRWSHLSYITRTQLFEQSGALGPQTVEGAVRINFPAAQVVTIATEDMPDPIAGAPAAAREAYHRGELVWPPVTVGSVVVSTSHVDVGRAMPALYLERWDAASGDPMSRINLSVDNYVFHRFSAGGQHLLICQRSPNEDGEYLWHIHEAATGRLVTSLRNRISTPRHAVASGVLVYESGAHSDLVNGQPMEVPRQLIAVDLETGEELWVRQLRETEYRGPFPP